MSDDDSENGHDPDDEREADEDSPDPTDGSGPDEDDDHLEESDTTEKAESNGPPPDSDTADSAADGARDSAESEGFDNPLDGVDVDDEEFATPLGGGAAGEPDGPDGGERADDDFDNPLEDVGSGEGAVDDIDDVFTEMDVPELDEESVWEELAVDTDGTEDEAERLLAGDAAAEAVVGEPAGSDEETVVPKTRYCHRCKYFSAPPEVACTHPGTEIVEVVDVERFRVRSCPVVEQRQGPAQELLSEDS